MRTSSTTPVDDFQLYTFNEAAKLLRATRSMMATMIERGDLSLIHGRGKTWIPGFQISPLLPHRNARKSYHFPDTDHLF